MRAILTVSLLLFADTLLAGALPIPEGDVILTVGGNIAVTNGDGVAQFDRSMLEELEQRTTTTATP